MSLGADTIVLGLGGNVGGDEAVLARMKSVLAAVGAWGRARASGVYRTAPIGGPAQADFLNAAIAVDAQPAPTPRELIEMVQELERLSGRARETETRWGPRPIDIDILLWGTRVIDREGPPRLRVPHEGLATRRFALAPVIDLVGDDLVLPGDGRPLGVCLTTVSHQRADLTSLILGEE